MHGYVDYAARTDNGWRRALRGAAAVLAVALAARVSVELPGSPVPQSAQTLAVLLTGAWLGARGGAGAMLAYIGAGAAGLPVFADGGSGLERLWGPTAGYLAGFVVAAGGVGWAAGRGWLTGWGQGFAVMLAGHVVVLASGALWLVRFLGAPAALAQGVVPFVWGAVVKSGVAAGVLVLAARRRGLLSEP